jgi:hypothetical protein
MTEERKPAEPLRCPICDWPMAESVDKGCVPGNCEYRPHQGTPEYYRIQERRKQLDRPAELREAAPSIEGILNECEGAIEDLLNPMSVPHEDAVRHAHKAHDAIQRYFRGDGTEERVTLPAPSTSARELDTEIEKARKERERSHKRGDHYQVKYWGGFLDAALFAKGLLALHSRELTERLNESRREFAIVSRACGNWREWPEGTVSKGVPSYEHEDWLAAARAIFERNELRAHSRERDAALLELMAKWRAYSLPNPCEECLEMCADELEAALAAREGSK